MLAELDATTIDWTDFEEAGRRTRDIARRLAADKATLRDLVHAVEDDPVLMAGCERHELLDYIVIYDALDRGFRIRVHLSTDVHEDRPHDHRFSFSSFIARGQYRHCWHSVSHDVHAGAGNTEGWITKRSPDPRDAISGADIRPVLVRTERAGDAYTLHHSVVHTTVTTPDTVSIFVRGPAEKDRSIIFDRATGTYWWRHGAERENADRRRDKRMSIADLRRFRARLEALGVI